MKPFIFSEDKTKSSDGCDCIYSVKVYFSSFSFLFQYLLMHLCVHCTCSGKSNSVYCFMYSVFDSDPNRYHISHTVHQNHLHDIVNGTDESLMDKIETLKIELFIKTMFRKSTSKHTIYFYFKICT